MRSCNTEHKQRGLLSTDNLRSKEEERNGPRTRARAGESTKVDMARAVKVAEGLCSAESCKLSISSRFRERMKQLQRAEIGLDLGCRHAPLQVASSRRLSKPARNEVPHLPLPRDAAAQWCCVSLLNLASVV